MLIYMRILLFLTLCMFGLPAMAADTLHLKNGDKLTGHISKYLVNQVNIETKYGVFDIPVDDLGGVASPRAEIEQAIQQIMATPSDTTTPIPSAMTKDDTTDVATETTTDIAALSDAAEDAEPEPDLFWGATWSGNANLGAELRSGNSEQEGGNADLTLKAKWDKHRGEIAADFNREEDDGDTTVDNRSLGLTHDYFFAEKWFLENFAGFEQDDIDLLDLRTILATGLGYQAYEQDDLNLKFVLGPGYQDEEFSNGEEDTSLTARWAMDYDQKFFEDLFRLFHKHSLNTPTDDTSAYLFQSKSGIRLPLKRGIVASGQVYFDWDNDPAAGTVEDDTTYSVKLGYEW